MVDGTHFHFRLDFSKPRNRQSGSGVYGFFDYSVDNFDCILRILSTDKEVFATQSVDKTFILLARDHVDRYIIHYLLLVHYQGNGLAAERGTTTSLFVPMENLDVLKLLKPVKRQTILV